MVKLLWHKMLRDMRRSWVTYLICAGIVAVGFCGYSVLSVCMDNLERSRTYFFQETNYCDGYAVMEQAPLSLVKKLRELPGVEHVEGRLVQEVPVRGFPSDETHLKLISVTGEGMNIPLLESGRQPEAGEPELVVGSGFYKAHQLSAGDELTLSIYGVERTLRVCGQGISPENIYMIKSLQEMLPAVDRYDAAFISYDTMAELFGQKGMANQFLFSMADGHSFAEIKDAVEEILKPYGFLQAYEGDEELSVSVIDLELEQVGKVSDSIPFLFLGVAAIILYIMLHRLLEQQRVQMGTLMALGIRPKWIRLHYMCYGLAVGVSGSLAGGLLGNLSAGPMTEFYRVFFQLPKVNTRLSPGYLLYGVVLAGVFCGGVAWLCTGKVKKLTPSGALRPEAPPAARRFFLERIPGFSSLFTVPGMIGLRSLARHRKRTLLALLGIACAFMITASLVSMNTLFDVFLFDELEKNQQQDITVHFNGLVKESDALEAVSNPLVERAEGILTVSVKLKTKAGEMDSTVDAISEDARLSRIYDKDGNVLTVKREGIIISELMAEQLNLRVGDSLTLTVYYPEELSVQVPVSGVMAQYIGSNAYMSKEALGNLTPYRKVVNSVRLTAPEEVQKELSEALKQSPLVGTIETRQEHIDQYRSLMGMMGSVMATMEALGVLIGLAVIYTSSLIYYEEQKREISTMMMLGLKSRQCLDVIAVGQWVLAVGGILLGIPMSMWASKAISSSMGSELYVIPDFIDGSSVALSVVLTFVAVWFSSRMMLRKLKRIIPVELLRERE